MKSFSIHVGISICSDTTAFFYMFLGTAVLYLACIMVIKHAFHATPIYRNTLAQDHGRTSSSMVR